MATQPTSRDVASAAGVSQSTVSYVLSGKRFVAPETHARVLAAMEELGYRPHASARALRSRRSGVVGLVVPYHELTDTTSQYRYVVSLAAACRKRDYELLVTSSEEGVAGMRRLIDSAQCDGLLIMDVLQDDPRIEAARSAAIPCVFIGISGDTRGVVAVDTDFEEIARSCVDQLAGRGHSRAVLLSPSSPHVTPMGFHQRFTRTVHRAGAEAGLELSTLEVERGYAPMRRALEDSGAWRTAPAFIVGPGLSPDDAVNSLVLMGRTPGQDLSLIAAAGPPEVYHAVIPYTYYDADVPRVTEEATARLAQLLTDSDCQASVTTVPPIAVQGLTLAPA